MEDFDFDLPPRALPPFPRLLAAPPRALAAADAAFRLEEATKKKKKT